MHCIFLKWATGPYTAPLNLYVEKENYNILNVCVSVSYKITDGLTGRQSGVLVRALDRDLEEGRVVTSPSVMKRPG